MPTISLINDSGSLPTGLNASPGDQAFVKDASMRYHFIDLSLVSSRSLTFDGSSVVVDKIDSSGNSPSTSPFTSTENFSQSQFNYVIGGDATKTLVSYTIDSNQITPISHNRYRGSFPYISLSTSGNNLIRPTSFLLDGDSTLKLDATGDSNGIPDDASFWTDSTGTVNIDLQHDSANFDSFYQPWKIHTILKDKSSFSGSDRAVASRFNYGVANVEGVLTWKQNEVIYNGVRHTPAEKGNGNDTENNVSSNVNRFVHSALEYDGEGELTQHYNGVNYQMVPDGNYSFQSGLLNNKNFERDRDASFRARVYFPSSMNADAVLFSLGNGTGSVTDIKFDAGTQLLKINCRQLSASANISSYMDDAYHVITWFIEVNPARFYLYIDGNRIISTGAAGILTNGLWAEGAASGITSVSVDTNNDILYQPMHVNAESFHFNNLVNSTRVHNGNVFTNHTMNDRRTYFIVNKTIPIGASQFFYFEQNWVGKRHNAGQYMHYANILSYIVDGRWDGFGGTSNAYGPDVDSRYWIGDTLLPMVKMNPADNHRGRFQARFGCVNDSFDYGNNTQFMFDPVEGLLFTFYRGRFFYSAYKRRIIVGEDQRLNPTGLGYTPGQQNGYPSEAALDNPGYRFMFNNLNFAYGENFTTGFDPTLSGGGARMLRRASGTGSTGGDAESEIRFNPSTWQYNPLEMINEVATQINSNPTDFGLPSGFTYDISRAGYEGIYAKSGTLVSPWPQKASEPHGRLRYYPQRLKGLREPPVKIGTAKTSLNPLNKNGLSFAQNYVAKTGGVVRQINTGNYAELYTYIKNIVQDGDAVVLSPGHYSYTDTDTSADRYSESSPFGRPHKNFLICGNTDKPGDVKICFYPLGYSNSFSQYNNVDIKAPIWGSEANEDCGLAFLTIQRFKHNYYRDRLAIHYNSKGGFAESVIFDFADNEYGSDATNYSYNKFQLLYDDRAQYSVANNQKRFRFFRNCQFKNYGTSRNSNVERFTSSYSYSPGWSLHIENCAFSSRTGILDDIGVDRRGLVIDEALMDSYGSSDINFHGYINSINIRSNYIDSSQAINPRGVSADSDYLSKIYQWMSTPDPKNRVLIDARFKELEVLSVDAQGQVFTKKKLRTSFNNTTDAWNFNTLEWNKDSNTARITNNGVHVDTVTNFFDSHNISNTRLVLGGRYKFVDGRIPSFVYEASKSGDTVKDFHLNKALRFDSTPFSVPTTEPSRDNNTVLLTAQGETIDSNATIIGAAVTHGEFSPYTAGERGWRKSSVSRNMWDSARILKIFKRSPDGPLSADGPAPRSPNGDFGDMGLPNLDLNYEDVFLTYDSNFHSGVSDSASLRFDVEVALSNTDANGKSISWSYEDMQYPRAARIGVDSTGYNYIISKVQSDFRNRQPQALVRFTPRMTDSTDSSQIMTYYIQNETELKPFGTVDVYYNRWEASLIINEGQNTFAFAEVRVLPPGRDPSMYTYDSDMIPSVMNIASNILVNYDSVGALPI